MRRSNTASLGELLKDLIATEYPQAAEHLDEMHLVENWPRVVGDYVQSKTERLEVRNHYLYVRLSSPVLKNELFNNRQLLVQKLNDSVSKMVITDIKFD